MLHFTFTMCRSSREQPACDGGDKNMDVEQKCMCVIETRTARTSELEAVVKMQEEYNKYNLAPRDRRKHGFLSLVTDFEKLKVLNDDLGVMVALCDDRIVGYEIPVGLHHCDDIPLFIPMREQILKLSIDGTPLTAENTIISGQICVDKAYRSRTVGEALHFGLLERLRDNYEFTVVEIDELNTRSMHFSQEKLGLQKISVYEAFEADWHILGQRISDACLAGIGVLSEDIVFSDSHSVL